MTQLRSSSSKESPLKFRVLTFLFGFAFIVLIGRLFYWQVVVAEGLASEARLQYQTGQKISAPRGNILASDGTWLAARGEVWKAYAWLPDITDVSGMADKLAPYTVEEEGNDFLLEEANRIKSVLSRQDVNWVPIQNRLDKETKRKIEEMDLSGIGFDPEEIRLYPEASAAAHILGFVGKDEEGESTGYFGLEGYYDLPLSGKPGFVERERDAIGSPIFNGTSLEISAIGGVDLQTHINKSVQKSLEEKLLSGIERYGAKDGSVVVMDPSTGAILGAASFPSYDPEHYYDFSNEHFRTNIVSDAFEPGSIFKVIVMAAGLDAGVVDPDTKCDICDGPLQIDEYEIETWNREYRKDSTMTDVIVHSDNVGMAFVADKLGSERLYEYLDKFGIGRKTNVDLQGEIEGTLRSPDKWAKVDQAAVSFGQGVATSPMQIVKAVGVIANGGYDVTPQVVDKLIAPGWTEDIEPVIGEQVLSEEAVLDITAMMVSAAHDGESKWTDLPGFNVAGKTGTAQIAIRGHYDEEKTIASFVGFAPAKDPKFVMLVTLREPESSQWASETAAPLWYDIAEDLFLLFGIQPEN